YINTEEHANGVSSLIPASTISGYSNITVDVIKPSIGGHSREDIDSIRFNAPKSYQRQGRALTPEDYVDIIKQNFPFVQSAYAWGGEENNPPIYGSVVVSVLPITGGVLTDSSKLEIISFLKNYNVGSVTPVITEPTIFYLDLDISFDYNPR